MTTTTIINKKTVTWNLKPMATGEHTRKDLVARGFDGVVYAGESVLTGRQAARVGLFYRESNTGNFVKFA